jgi:hypothetical protein
MASIFLEPSMKHSFPLGLAAVLGGAAVSVFALAAAFDPHLSVLWSLVPTAISLALFVLAHRALASDHPDAKVVTEVRS